MVRVEGFEPPCNQLPFQDLIRVRGYTRLCFSDSDELPNAFA